MPAQWWLPRRLSTFREANAPTKKAEKLFPTDPFATKPGEEVWVTKLSEGPWHALYRRPWPEEPEEEIP